MKKTHVLSVVVAAVGVTASLALAAPPAGKGKPPKTGVGCKPQITVVLRGTIGTPPGATGTSLTLAVTGTNAWGKAYNHSTVSLGIDAKTKMRRNGAKTQGALLNGDRALVQARACKADLANSAKPTLVATRIVAHPATAS